MIAPKGAPIEIPVTIGGVARTLKGAMQPEYERRFNLHPQAGEMAQKDPLAAIAASILGMFRDVAPEHTSIAAGPLSSRFGHVFHRILKDQSQDGIPMEMALPFTKLIQGNPFEYPFKDPVTREWVTANEYRVGLQQEKAVYYETPELALARNAKGPFAVRVKSWNLELPSENGPSAQSLFVKRTLGYGDLFTLREEFNIPLPAGMADAEILHAAQQLLKVAGLDDASKFELLPTVETDNTRYGIVLLEAFRSPEAKLGYDAKQVGYISIDAFTTRDLRRSGSERSPLTYQVETELLPDEAGVVETRHDALEDFFRKIEEKLDGKLDPRPKYIQGLSGFGVEEPYPISASEFLDEKRLLSPDIEQVKAAIERIEQLPQEMTGLKIRRFLLGLENPDPKIKGFVLSATGFIHHYRYLFGSDGIRNAIVANVWSLHAEVALGAMQALGNWIRYKHDDDLFKVLALLLKDRKLTLAARIALTHGLSHISRHEYFEPLEDAVAGLPPLDLSQAYQEVVFLRQMVQGLEYFSRFAPTRERFEAIAQALEARFDEILSHGKSLGGDVQYEAERYRYVLNGFRRR